jgi:phosphoglycolate phosphatase
MAKPDMQAIIFDLDGTLVDSSGDVLTCIRDAFSELQYNMENTLSAACIGPPLIDMLRQLAPSQPDEVLEKIVVNFRKRYADSGFRDTVIYDGVMPLLAQLKQQGIACLIATNKPRYLTEELLKRKELSEYFQGLMCIGDNGITGKTGLVSALIDQHGVTPLHSIVIGDGVGDIEAAKLLGMMSIAHLGGYGAAEELLACKPTYAIDSMTEATTLLNTLLAGVTLITEPSRA